MRVSKATSFFASEMADAASIKDCLAQTGGDIEEDEQEEADDVGEGEM